jgi:hypothetical protein
MSDLDFDQLVHTPEGRLVIEVMQGRRLPLMIAMQDRGELIFWYPPVILENMANDAERTLEWVRLLEEHARRLQDTVPKQ